MSSLVKRSIISVSWNMVLSLVQILVGFVRSVLLARLISPEIHGIYHFADSTIMLSAVVANFGMAGGFLFRNKETENEEQAAAVHLTLKVIFTAVWLLALVISIVIFATDQTRLALLVRTFTQAVVLLCQTPALIFERRVAHRRLALLQSLNILISAITAVLLAWRGISLWALLSTDMITVIVTVFFLYIWRPVWRPRLAWSPSTVRYFLNYGSRSMPAQGLLRALDKVDDIWTGIFLGEGPMGYYSRAYSFATYPRTILAQSINKVAGGTYAEVAHNRSRLSRAFFRTNAFLVRSGFYLAGILMLIAPEFIRILLGIEWLPMLNAFRLMLIFTLFDPIKITVANLFLAIGKPEEVVRARLIQLSVMLIGLFALGPRWGIAGVALAVDVMLVAGIVILLRKSRKYVDFSVKTLFFVPGLGVVIGIVLARAAIMLPGILGSPWRTGIVKIVVFTFLYGAFLLLFERQRLLGMVLVLLKLLREGDSRSEMVS